MLHGTMPGIAQNPSKRAVYKVVLCLRVATLALLGTLVLAASAQAADGGSAGRRRSAEAPSGSVAPESGGTGGSTEPAPEAVGGPAAPETTPEKAPEKAPETVSVAGARKRAGRKSTGNKSTGNLHACRSGTTGSRKTGSPGTILLEIVPELPKIELPKIVEKAPESKGGGGSEKEAVSVVTGPEKTSEDPPAPTIVGTPVALTRNDLGYASPEIGYEAAPDVSGALINSPTEPPTGGRWKSLPLKLRPLRPRSPRFPTRSGPES